MYIRILAYLSSKPCKDNSPYFRRTHEHIGSYKQDPMSNLLCIVKVLPRLFRDKLWSRDCSHRRHNCNTCYHTHRTHRDTFGNMDSLLWGKLCSFLATNCFVSIMLKSLGETFDNKTPIIQTLWQNNGTLEFTAIGKTICKAISFLALTLIFALKPEINIPESRPVYARCDNLNTYGQVSYKLIRSLFISQLGRFYLWHDLYNSFW